MTQEASQAQYEESLKRLSYQLAEVYGQKPVILIDEYDTPIHAAWVKGYYDEMIDFMRNLLSAAFKDNPYLFKGVLTGCLRISKESIFTGLNNLSVCTILDQEFADKFGFTIEEVRELLALFGMEDRLEEVLNWYDGYKFGEYTILNPWSVINFIMRKRPAPYWANTSSNDLIRKLLEEAGLEFREALQRLLQGGSVTSQIDENISFPDLTKSTKHIYSLLFFSGYLKCSRLWYEDVTAFCELTIPNKEVWSIYRDIISSWVEASYENEKLKLMLEALVTKRVDLFERLLNDFVVSTLSYFDTKGKNPEAVYQGFIAGMLLNLGPEYEVKTNREAGYGRYDILVKPKDREKTAVILELKSIGGIFEEEPEKALSEALLQIEERGYARELMVEGYTDILKLAVVSDGKRVWVKVFE
jgi:hypothetical protein